MFQGQFGLEMAIGIQGFGWNTKLFPGNFHHGLESGGTGNFNIRHGLRIDWR